MATRRPLNLDQRGMTIGAAQPFPAVAMAREKKQDNEAVFAPLAAALSEGDLTRPLEGGGWGEALARFGEGYLRTRGEFEQQAQERSRYADALNRENADAKGEAEDRDLRRQVLQGQIEERNRPETHVTPSGTFWSQNRDGTPQILGRDPNWQPPAAMVPQQWQPLSPQTAQRYPNLNPGDVQENAITGEIQQIPGAQQRQRVTERQQRAVQSAMSSIQSADNVLGSVQSALRAVQSNPTFTTGWVGARLRGVEGSPAYDLDRTIDTIKANLGFEALSQMRAESPTGGALGNVTEIELRMLQSVIDSLDSAQSAPQLEEALNGVRNYLIGRRQRMQRMLEAYQQDFGSVTEEPASPSAGDSGVESLSIEELMQLREQLRGQ